MSEQQAGFGDYLGISAREERLGNVNILGLPGQFTAWGIEFVRQILERAGCATEVVPLHQESPQPAGAHDQIRIQFALGAALPQSAPIAAAASATIIFIDEPARPVHELLARGHDMMDVVRIFSAAVSSLAPTVRAPGTLLVRRTPEMDLAATRDAIIAHLLPAAATPADPLSPETTFDMHLPAPPLRGQAQSLTRQILVPLTNLVTRTSRDTIAWPLTCFYSGDHPGEPAPPVLDVTGPARPLYYGPYFHLPAGSWCANVQLIFFDNLRDAAVAVDVAGREKLAEVRLRPRGNGLYQVSVPFLVDRAEHQIEVRVWLAVGAIEGLIGLNQVVLNFVEDDR